MANDLTLGQLSTVMNNVFHQATGQSAQAIVDTSSFVSVGQAALKTGYDPLIQSISQVLGQTMFSIRPYSRKFQGLKVTNQQFGNWQRKIHPVDSDMQDDESLPLTQGGSVDMYKVNKPGAVQMNFYGAQKYEKYLTFFKDQLDTAFSSVDDFGRFVSMYTLDSMNVIEQCHESIARATIANYIAGKTLSTDAANSVIHLLTEYNALTGLTLTATTVYLPANYKPFMQWVYSRIASLSSLLTERTTLYHTNLTGKAIPKHTPMANQKVFLYAPIKYGTESMVLADTFHENYLKFAAQETVNFWQSIETPDSINVKPVYLNADGTLTNSTTAVEVSEIFGAIIDEEAVGYTVVNQWASATAMNAAGGYFNQYYHFTDRYLNDFLENGIILLLN